MSRVGGCNDDGSYRLTSDILFLNTPSSFSEGYPIATMFFVMTEII